MRARAFVLLTLIAAVVFSAHAESRRRAVRGSGWTLPQCTQVLGFPAVSVTVDGGRSVLPQSESADQIQIDTFGLAALDRPNHLLAVTARLLLRSNDAGCSWTTVENFTFPHHLTRLVRAGADRVWASSILGPEIFLVGDSIEERRAPVPRPVTLYADRIDPNRLATGGDQGDIWWSEDGGATWTLKTTAPARPPIYAIEFSPRGREHAIATGMGDGAQVTFDGGATWVAARGVEGYNVFSVAFSPVDPDVVWAIALDPRVKGSAKRAIHRSIDGGRSFERVITGSASVQMTNGFVLAPHPRDASLLYFATHGTQFYLVDASGTIRLQSELPHRNVDSLVFSPVSPDVIYLGLKLSDMSAQWHR